MQQKVLAGTLSPRYALIERLAERFMDLRDETANAREAENGAKDELIVAMRKLNIDRYARGRFVIQLDTKSTVTVKTQPDEEADEAEEEK